MSSQPYNISDDIKINTSDVLDSFVDNDSDDDDDDDDDYSDTSSWVSSICAAEAEGSCGYDGSISSNSSYYHMQKKSIREQQPLLKGKMLPPTSSFSLPTRSTCNVVASALPITTTVTTASKISTTAVRKRVRTSDVSSMSSSSLSESSSDDDEDNDHEQHYQEARLEQQLIHRSRKRSNNLNDEGQRPPQEVVSYNHDVSTTTIHRYQHQQQQQPTFSSPTANKRLKSCNDDEESSSVSSTSFVPKIPSSLKSFQGSLKLNVAIGTKCQQQTHSSLSFDGENMNSLVIPVQHKKLCQPKRMANRHRHPLFTLGSDTMSHCMSYLCPLEVYNLLVEPICKDWYYLITKPQDLWRILCLSEPFKATVSTAISHQSYMMFDDTGRRCSASIGQFRLLYSSFINCVKYLDMIKVDTLKRRWCSKNKGAGNNSEKISSTCNSTPATTTTTTRINDINNSSNHTLITQRNIVPTTTTNLPTSPPHIQHTTTEVIGVSTNNKRQKLNQLSSSSSSSLAKVKYSSRSSLTQNLLGPAKNGQVGQDLNLPWSCAIYSLLNWMGTFPDVEGIQTMCLQVFPLLLEDESQRTTAQNAGLNQKIINCMLTFPNSVQLHTAAFHAMVILTRPIGGKEGMILQNSTIHNDRTENRHNLFTTTNINDSNRKGINNRTKPSGLTILLDSMKRFETDEDLQSMACWSFVNISLISSQKSALVKLGGIQSITNAMIKHPNSSEVQFRAMFALINLVIPSSSSEIPSTAPLGNDTELGVTRPPHSNQQQNSQRGMNATAEDEGEEADAERQILEDNVTEIARLVVDALKNFYHLPTIVNRACLVLHNLALTKDYRMKLLWTPSCYQMVDWCLSNYPNDAIIKKSARSILARLQLLLGSCDKLRTSFMSFVHEQQKLLSKDANQKSSNLSYEQQRREEEMVQS